MTIKTILLTLITISYSSTTLSANKAAQTLYDQGQFVEAYALFLETANAGDRDSVTMLGLMNQLGRGVSKNKKAALEWFLLAADSGDLNAAMFAGDLHTSNEDQSTNNYFEAQRLYEIALNGGMSEAALPLGKIYTTSALGKVDLNKALELLKIAANNPAGGKSVAEAAILIARIHRGGNPGIPKDEQEELKWLEVAANNKDVEASSEIGLEYYKGEKLKKDNDKAYRFVQFAAVNGHAKAQFNLGIFYYQGIGIRKDISKAVAWFMIAKDTDPSTDNGTLDRFKNAMNATQLTAAEKEYDRLNYRVNR